MPLKEPQSMDECVYFSNRILGEKGKARVWVFREKCPKCNEGLMGKPLDAKTGRPKIRTKEFQCPKCKYSLPQEEYEDSLNANIQYTCPHCQNKDELQISFKRQKVRIENPETGKKKTKQAIRFQCSKCSKNIDIIKFK